MNIATEHSTPTAETRAQRVWRIEVRPADPTDDPFGANVLHGATEGRLAAALSDVRSARVFLIEADLDEAVVQRIADGLLADPVNQTAALGTGPGPDDGQVVEVHYLPGVMDPVADSTRDAITELLDLPADRAPEVRTGYRYDMIGATREEGERIAHRLLANPVVQSVTFEPYHPESFLRGQRVPMNVQHVPITSLNDDGLRTLSRSGHLFLSLPEMQAIQNEYRDAGREPTDIELETLAQTWSEHCVHKTLKSRIHYGEHGADSPSDIDWSTRPGHTVQADGSVIIDNLLKSTIAAATEQLRSDGVDWCISVFVDNAGVIAFDDTDAVTFKVETHNHPSALEPYGGAATGIGGCIRDTMGTGLAARPIANTDVFCVAFPDGWATASDEESDDSTQPIPKGVLHPKRILQQVVAGVRDYGNRMGIPTVNGAVYFDDRYLGNPLVFCGSIGLIPRDLAFGDARGGDHIIVLGGRTGRDGIHGATFSSAELTDTHADEFSHAVQIGNAITQKKTLDVILAARDEPDGPLFHAITDCGAGGYSSAVGEMGESLGAVVHLERAPLKYQGLSYTEIWISEAQERMVLAVPPEYLDRVLTMAADEDVEACDLGHFGTDDRQLLLNYDSTEVGRLGMAFLHNGLPQLTREARWEGLTETDASPNRARPSAQTSSDDIGDLLLALLAHPNIASKHWIIRQYDHEVQGGSVVKPLAGAADGPSDASVLRPKLDSQRGIALSLGLATALGDIDPYWMTLAAIDEAVRNLVCVGARPDRIALLDNFCWANCEDPTQLGALVRAAEACYDGALAYRTPFISGKDSLNNEFKLDTGQTIAIPPTLLISAIGLVNDVGTCVTMDAKAPGNLLIQVGLTTSAMAGSHLQLITRPAGTDLPKVDLGLAPQCMAVVARLIGEGRVRAAHDCSEGGMLVAAAEMALAGDIGLRVDLAGVPKLSTVDQAAACFAETPSRILLEIEPKQFDAVARQLRDERIPFGQIGTFDKSPRFDVRCDDRGQMVNMPLNQLADAWRKPLDW